MRRLAAVATVALVVTACTPVTNVEAPLTPASARMFEGTATAIVPLADGRVMVDATDGLWIFAEPGMPAARIGEPGELGAITAWAAIDGSTLIAAEDGVVLVRGAGLVAAPLGAVLDEGESVVALAATSRLGHDSDLWVVTSSGLRLFRDGALSPVELEDHDLAAAIIAPAGPGALWAVANGTLLRITIDDDDVIRATSYARPIDITSLTSDARGVPWMIAGGVLHALEPDGTLLRFELGDVLVTARASVSGPDVWVEGEAGAWHAMGRVARPVHGMPDPAAPLPGVDGDAFVLGAEGVDRFRARHRASLDGLNEGARVVERVEAHVVLELEEGAQVTARIDRQPVEVDGTTIAIDPATLAVGAHRLDVFVSWPDGTLPTALVRRFAIAPAVTWTEHIRPIYVDQCADCHGAAGPSPTRLDAPELWESGIVRILDNVTTGRMPLGRPALSPDAITLIQTWSMTGFPE